jgi:hypothetical protein
MADGQTIPNRVLCSIAHQSMMVDIFPVVTPGVVESNHDKCKDKAGKLEGELRSRNKALDFIRSSKEEFVVMQDRDVIHLEPDNLEKVVWHMKQDKNLGICSLPWKEYRITDHIRMMCMVMRVSFLDNFSFKLDNRYHMCLNMMEEAKALGFRCEYYASPIRMVKEM